MIEYHKVENVYKRDPDAPGNVRMEGVYTDPAFGYLAQNEWVFTEKVDGTNIRVIYQPDLGVTFAGRTDRASLPGPLVIRLQELFSPERAALHERFPEGVCLYGEGYGGKIQGGSATYGPNQDFVLFDVMIKGNWLGRDAVNGIASDLGIRAVPVIGYGTLLDGVKLVRHGLLSRWGDFFAEGIMARPAVEMRNQWGGRVITKIKHRDFYAQ